MIALKLQAVSHDTTCLVIEAFTLIPYGGYVLRVINLLVFKKIMCRKKIIYLVHNSFLTDFEPIYYFYYLLQGCS